MGSIVNLEQRSKKEILKAWHRSWNPNGGVNFTLEHLTNFIYINKILLPYSLGITYQNNLIAFSLFAMDDHANSWLGNIAVDPDFRGKGLLRTLLHNQLELAQSLKIKQVSLEVESNSIAYTTYKKFGFEEQRKLYNYEIDIQDWGRENLRSSDFYTVSSEQYFLGRKQCCSIFPWRRQEKSIRSYKNLFFFSSTNSQAGYSLTLNTPHSLIDCWAVCEEGAQILFANLLTRVDKAILINQITDGIVTYLTSKNVTPQKTCWEMSLKLL